MKAKQVLGKDLMLFVGGKAIALATSCKLGVSSETIDTQSKDSGMWGEKGVKKLGWNCSSENCFSADTGINGYDELFAAFVAAEPVDIAFGIPANKSNAMPLNGWTLPLRPYMGKAIITSLELNAPDGDKATFSVSLDGTGALAEPCEGASVSSVALDYTFIPDKFSTPLNFDESSTLELYCKRLTPERAYVMISSSIESDRSTIVSKAVPFSSLATGVVVDETTIGGSLIAAHTNIKHIAVVCNKYVIYQAIYSQGI